MSVEVLLVTTGRIINKPREQRGGAETQTRISERKHVATNRRVQGPQAISRIRVRGTGSGDNCLRLEDRY